MDGRTDGWTVATFFLTSLFLCLLSFSRIVERRRLDSALVCLLVFFLTQLFASYLAASYYLRTRVGRSSSGRRRARNKEGFLAKPKRIMRCDELPIDRRDFTRDVCLLQNRSPLIFMDYGCLDFDIKSRHVLVMNKRNSG